MSAATIQFLCPACQQPFVSMLQHAQAVQGCPHCAYTGSVDRFEQMTSLPGLVNQARRTARRTAPAESAAAAAIQAPQHSTSTQGGFEIKVYKAIQTGNGSAHMRPPATPMQPAPPAVIHSPNWEATQAWAESRALQRGLPAEPPAPVVEVADAPVIEEEPPFTVLSGRKSIDWASMKSGTQPKLAPWPGMAPSTDTGDISDFDAKPKRNYLLWSGVALATLAVAGLLTAIIFERNRTRDEVATLSRSVDAAADAAKTPLPTVLPAVPNEPASPTAPALSIKDIQKVGNDLIQTLFTANTTEERLACIADAGHQRRSLEQFFAGLTKPVQLRGFRALPTPVKAMPGAQLMTLCEVASDYHPQGTAITRLITDDDDKVKLDWPMLRDSLQGTLAEYSKAPVAEPRWVMIGLRRNFGFDESEELRKEYFAFDLQGQGDGSDRTVALVNKNSPTGRALDKALAWNELYMARTLLHWETIGETKRLGVLDAELISAARADGP